MFSAISKGIGQLSDRGTRKYLWFSVLAALLTFIILWSTVGWLLSSTSISTLGWLEGAVDVLGGLATVVITWFLFPATVSAVIGFFLDQVAECVERRHYPGIPTAAGQPLGEALITSSKFLAILIILNILLLPLLFLGPVFPFIFYAVNGYLLGREYFELVASRRLKVDEVVALRKAHQGTIIMIGIAIAFLLTIPVVNLLMPIVATSAMVHLYEQWRPSGQAQPPARA